MKLLLISLFVVTTLSASSLYLPINSKISHDVDKMVLLSKMPSAKRPYSIKLLHQYNQKIRHTYPKLYKRLEASLKKLLQNITIESAKIQLNHSNSDLILNNSNGVNTNSTYYFEATSFIHATDYLQTSLNISQYQENEHSTIASNNSYISFGWDTFQVDIGYRDHWYGVAKNSALVLSNNAINSPSITISSNPITSYHIEYDFFYTKLDETDGIVYQEKYHTGNPHLIGMHSSFTLFNFLEFGANRTLFFGGGPRGNINSPTDIYNALFDTNNFDNFHDGFTQDQEFGNQLASITLKMNAEFNKTPFSLYWELGAEDTGSTTIYYFGNSAATIGLYLPLLSDKHSLRYEQTSFQDSWYTHHLYADGYTNQNSSLGHWIKNHRPTNGSSPANSYELSHTYQDKAWLMENTLTVIDLEDIEQKAIGVTSNLRFDYSSLHYEYQISIYRNFQDELEICNTIGVIF
jgi:hypothetical protein